MFKDFKQDISQYISNTELLFWTSCVKEWLSGSELKVTMSLADRKCNPLLPLKNSLKQCIINFPVL